jgi:hypothetical protein
MPPAGAFWIAGLSRGNVRVQVEQRYHGAPFMKTIAVGEARADLELRLRCPP